METHSNILAWGIPWTEEPGGLQSRGHKESDMTERLSRASEQGLWARKGCAALFCHQEGWRSGSALPQGVPAMRWDLDHSPGPPPCARLPDSVLPPHMTTPRASPLCRPRGLPFTL